MLFISVPALVLAGVGPFIVLFVVIVCKPKKSIRNNLRQFEKTTSIKHIDYTDYCSSFRQSFCCFLYLFLLMSGGLATLFFQLFLLKVSYMYHLQPQRCSRLLFHAADIRHSCDQHEEAKECFKYDVLNKISEGTIDCNSAAVQNGTTDVKCYRIVFNMDLTADVSYNGFQLSMVLLNLVTGAVLTLAISKLYLITF